MKRLLPLILCLLLAAPALAQSLRVHAWHDAGQANINPMIWVSPAQGYGTYDPDPVVAAERVAPLLDARSKGRRVLFFWHPFPRLDLSDPARRVALGFEYASAWYERFFWRLHQLDAPRIDLLVLDHEQGIQTWHFPNDVRTEAFAKILDDRSAQRQLPKHLRGLAITGWPWNREDYIAWNAWADQQHYSALRSAIAVPSNRALGYPVRFSQYNAARYSATQPVSDRNGWPLASVATTISSPSLYPTTDADLERCLAVARSARARGTVIPWIAYPAYIGRERFAKLVAGLREIGVTEMLLWNPRQFHTDEQWAQDMAFVAGVVN